MLKIKTPLIKGVLGRVQGIQIIDDPKKYRRLPKKTLDLFSVICPSSNTCKNKSKCPHRGPHDRLSSCDETMHTFKALKHTSLCKPCVSYQDFKRNPHSRFRENIRQLQILTTPETKNRKKKKKLRKTY